MNHPEPFSDIFSTLFSSLQNLLPRRILNRALDNAGQKLGLETLTRYRSARTKSGPMTARDYVRAMVSGAIWSAKLITVKRNFIRFEVEGMPALREPHSFIPVLAGFFRSAAIVQFGQSSVAVSAGPNEGSFIIAVRFLDAKLLRDRDAVSAGGTKVTGVGPRASLRRKTTPVPAHLEDKIPHKARKQRDAPYRPASNPRSKQLRAHQKTKQSRI
jgi:hypothetical protein